MTSSQLVLAITFPLAVFIVALAAMSVPYILLRKWSVAALTPGWSKLLKHCLSASAGALLAIAFLGLQPQLYQSLTKITKFSPQSPHNVSLSDLLIICGFFLVWLLKFFITYCSEHCSSKSEETIPLKQTDTPTDNYITDKHESNDTNTNVSCSPSSASGISGCHHVPQDTKLSSLFIFAALFVKDVIEGLALGSMLNSDAVVVIVVGKCFHQFFCSLVLAINLAQADLSKTVAVILVLFYATGVSLPIAISVLVFQSAHSTGFLVFQVILLSLATGAVIYAVFLEMLSHQDVNRTLTHMLAVLAGFSLLAVVQATHLLMSPKSHAPHGDANSSTTTMSSSMHGM